jgi:hypothetical protein
MADFPTGTGFGKFISLKSMRLSNRDILLAIGIVVAAIITLTALVYRDQQAAAKKEIQVPKKTSMATIADRLIEIIGKHNSVKHIQ